MRDEEKQARREIERSTIFGEVLEQLDRDAPGGELYDALVARGYWNEEESEAVIQREWRGPRPLEDPADTPSNGTHRPNPSFAIHPIHATNCRETLVR